MGSRFKFPHRDRIRHQQHFKAVFDRAKRLENRSYRIYYAKAMGKQGKCAVIVSRKLGNSVSRHRTKRQIREILRLNYVHQNPAYDVIIVAKPDLKNQPFQVAESQAIELLSRMR